MSDNNAAQAAEEQRMNERDEAAMMAALRNSLFPGASDSSIEMVLAYCKAAGLDPMTKPVHIVPMSVKKPGSRDQYEYRDVVMPGIELYRTKAHRTGAYAGKDRAVFGTDITMMLDQVEVTFPEWCEVTVYRIVQGHRVPFTETVWWLETYATAKRDTAAPNSMWRKRTRGQLAKCFDPETEVLTTNGFERFDRVTGMIMQVTDNGIEPCDAVPFRQDYDGPMIVAPGTRLNFAVTPDHDMITPHGKVEAMELFKNATTDTGKMSLVRTVESNRADADVSDEQLRLAGYCLADGHINRHRVVVAVSREYKIAALQKLAMHDRESLKHDAGRVGMIGDRSVVTRSDKLQFFYDFALISSIISSDKRLLRHDLSARQASIIVDALVAFDGCVSRNGVRRLTQKNANVAAAFEVAAVQAGYAISRRRKIGAANTYVYTLSSAPSAPVIRAARRKQRNNGKAPAHGLMLMRNESGEVWCATVPSGVLVVRRRGFSMLAGNCAEAAALRAGFPEIGAQPTADEMAGKALIYDEPPAIPIQRITEEQAKELDKLLTDTGSDKAKFLKYVQADKLEDIQASAFADAVTMIESAARRRKLESVLADLRDEVSASDLDTALAALDASDLDDKGKASIRRQLQAEASA